MKRALLIILTAVMIFTAAFSFSSCGKKEMTPLEKFTSGFNKASEMFISNTSASAAEYNKADYTISINKFESSEMLGSDISELINGTKLNIGCIATSDKTAAFNVTLQIAGEEVELKGETAENGDIFISLPEFSSVFAYANMTDLASTLNESGAAIPDANKLINDIQSVLNEIKTKYLTEERISESTLEENGKTYTVVSLNLNKDDLKDIFEKIEKVFQSFADGEELQFNENNEIAGTISVKYDKNEPVLASALFEGSNDDGQPCKLEASLTLSDKNNISFLFGIFKNDEKIVDASLNITANGENIEGIFALKAVVEDENKDIKIEFKGKAAEKSGDLNCSVTLTDNGSAITVPYSIKYTVDNSKAEFEFSINTTILGTTVDISCKSAFTKVEAQAPGTYDKTNGFDIVELMNGSEPDNFQSFVSESLTNLQNNPALLGIVSQFMGGNNEDYDDFEAIFQIYNEYEAVTFYNNNTATWTVPYTSSVKSAGDGINYEIIINVSEELNYNIIIEGEKAFLNWDESVEYNVETSEYDGTTYWSIYSENSYLAFETSSDGTTYIYEHILYEMDDTTLKITFIARNNSETTFDYSIIEDTDGEKYFILDGYKYYYSDMN